jgi:Na+/proline symporter
VTPLLAAVGVYLAAQFAIGLYVSRRIATEDDYLLAGRRLGPWLATASLFATWFGAETIIGSAAVAYSDGISPANAEPFAYGLCIVGTGLLFAIPLWKRRLTTLADLFRQRYGTTVERVAAVVLLPPSILWAAAQIRAFGQVIVVTGATVPLEGAITAAAVIVIAYTAVGGMLADAITDLVQAGVLIVSLLILGVVVVHDAGGVGVVGAAVMASDQIQLRPVGDAPWWVLLEEWSIPLLGSLVASELVTRVIAARSPQVARGAALGAGAIYIIVGCIPLLLGIIAAPLFGTTLVDAEQVIPTLARESLPGWLYVVFAGGLVSAILSTVDSTLLVGAGLGAHNLVLPLLTAPSDRLKLRLTRGFVALGGVIAWYLALNAEGVLALIEASSAFGSAGILVTVVFALFTSFGGPRAALATLVGGVVTYVAATAAALPTPFLLSLAAALVLYVGVGLAERAPPPSRIAS